MYRKFTLVAAVLLGLMATPGTASAVELGLTPSQVFGLWTNINDGLLASARVISSDSAWHGSLDAMRAQKFDGKKPADVLAQVVEFRAKLDRLRQKSGLKPAKQFVNGDGKVTPSVVFLNSGHVLDGLADWLIRNTGPEQLIGPLYARLDINGKTPSDAFGVVELANRRLDQLLSKAGS